MFYSNKRQITKSFNCDNDKPVNAFSEVSYKPDGKKLFLAQTQKMLPSRS